MKFCTNCGSQLSDGANFVLIDTTQVAQSQQVKESTVKRLLLVANQSLWLIIEPSCYLLLLEH